MRGNRCLLLTAAKDRLNMIDITSTREREDDARGCYGPPSLRFSLSHPTKEQIVVNGQLWPSLACFGRLWLSWNHQESPYEKVTS